MEPYITITNRWLRQQQIRPSMKKKNSPVLVSAKKYCRWNGKKNENKLLQGWWFGFGGHNCFLSFFFVLTSLSLARELDVFDQCDISSLCCPLLEAAPLISLGDIETLEKIGNAWNRPRDGWVRGANVTSVQCRPPIYKASLPASITIQYMQNNFRLTYLAFGPNLESESVSGLGTLKTPGAIRSLKLTNFQLRSSHWIRDHFGALGTASRLD